MTQADAYNCAFRSHHLIRFNLWGLGGITGTKSASRAAKSESKITFFGSKSVQERSKRSSRGFLRASASKMRFRLYFGTILGVKKESLGHNK